MTLKLPQRLITAAAMCRRRTLQLYVNWLAAVVRIPPTADHPSHSKLWRSSAVSILFYAFSMPPRKRLQTALPIYHKRQSSLPPSIHPVARRDALLQVRS
jgi:hypothetical protein